MYLLNINVYGCYALLNVRMYIFDLSRDTAAITLRIRRERIESRTRTYLSYKVHKLTLQKLTKHTIQRK